MVVQSNQFRNQDLRGVQFSQQQNRVVQQPQQAQQAVQQAQSTPQMRTAVQERDDRSQSAQNVFDAKAAQIQADLENARAIYEQRGGTLAELKQASRDYKAAQDRANRLLREARNDRAREMQSARSEYVERVAPSSSGRSFQSGRVQGSTPRENVAIRAAVSQAYQAQKVAQNVPAPLRSGVYVGRKGEQVIVTRGANSNARAGEVIRQLQGGPFTPAQARLPVNVAAGVQRGDLVDFGATPLYARATNRSLIKLPRNLYIQKQPTSSENDTQPGRTASSVQPGILRSEDTIRPSPYSTGKLLVSQSSEGQKARSQVFQGAKAAVKELFIAPTRSASKVGILLAEENPLIASQQLAQRVTDVPSSVTRIANTPQGQRVIANAKDYLPPKTAQGQFFDPDLQNVAIATGLGVLGPIAPATTGAITTGIGVTTLGQAGQRFIQNPTPEQLGESTVTGTLGGLLVAEGGGSTIKLLRARSAAANLAGEPIVQAQVPDVLRDFDVVAREVQGKQTVRLTTDELGTRTQTSASKLVLGEPQVIKAREIPDLGAVRVTASAERQTATLPLSQSPRRFGNALAPAEFLNPPQTVEVSFLTTPEDLARRAPSLLFKEPGVVVERSFTGTPRPTTKAVSIITEPGAPQRFLEQVRVNEAYEGIPKEAVTLSPESTSGGATAGMRRINRELLGIETRPSAKQLEKFREVGVFLNEKTGDYVVVQETVPTYRGKKAEIAELNQRQTIVRGRLTPEQLKAYNTKRGGATPINPVVIEKVKPTTQSVIGRGVIASTAASGQVLLQQPKQKTAKPIQIIKEKQAQKSTGATLEQLYGTRKKRTQLVTVEQQQQPSQALASVRPEQAAFFNQQQAKTQAARTSTLSTNLLTGEGDTTITEPVVALAQPPQRPLYPSQLGTPTILYLLKRRGLTEQAKALMQAQQGETAQPQDLIFAYQAAQGQTASFISNQQAVQRQQQAVQTQFLDNLTGSTTRQKNPLIPKSVRKEELIPQTETTTPEPLVSAPKKRTVADVFGIFEKRRGKFVKVGEEVGKNAAIAKGAQITLGNLGATFSVRKTGEKAVTPFQLRQIEQRERSTRAPLELFRNYAVKNGKRVPLQDTFIQKRGTRLTTQAERQEIMSKRKSPVQFFKTSKKKARFI